MAVPISRWSNPKGGQAALLMVTMISLASLSQVQMASGQTAGENAESQQSGASIGGGAQLRQIYSQKLSPHRMMHFGKRPLYVPPPSIFIPPQHHQAGPGPLVELPIYHTGVGLPDARAPTLVSFGSTEDIFRSIPVSKEQLERANANKQLIDVVTNLLEISKQQQQVKERNGEKTRAHQLLLQQQQQQQRQQLLLQQQRQRPATIKFMKLIDTEGADDAQYDEVAEMERQQQAQQDNRTDQAGSAAGLQVEKHQGQQEPSAEQPDTQDDQNGPINIVNRSLPAIVRSDVKPNFSRAHLSSILFGRSRLSEAPASLLGLGNYIKKADPVSKMTFMHFG